MIGAGKDLDSTIENPPTSVASSSYAPLLDARDVVTGPPEDTQFVFLFPRAWEQHVEWMDDAIIAWCQRGADGPMGKLVVFFSKAVTVLTVIEIGFSLPIFLFLLTSADCAALLATYVMLTAAVLTQIPKRFIWRTRPFGAGRAQAIGKPLKTSSFPSRAVVGAVVYTHFIVVAFAQQNQDTCLLSFFPRLPIDWALMLIMAVVASAGRITLGVHYPSDCFCGALLGPSQPTPSPLLLGILLASSGRHTPHVTVGLFQVSPVAE